MSLFGLAIVGKKNEPLYLCDCQRLSLLATTAIDESSHPDDDCPTDTTADLEHDVPPDPTGGGGGAGASTRLPSPSDDDDDHDDANATDPFGFFQAEKDHGSGHSLSREWCFILHSSLDHCMERIETTGAGLPVPRGRTGSWLGRIATMEEEFSVFGRISATSIKLLALTAVSARDMDVRTFLEEVHAKYVELLMNPFTELRGPIRSSIFDRQIKQAVRNYELKRTFEI